MRATWRTGAFAAFLLLAAGCQKAPPPAPRQLSHGDRSRPAVALTFDACSSPNENKFDAAVVDALEAARAPATFFLGGRWMEAQPDAVRRLARNRRFELGLHGYTHPHFDALSRRQAEEELAKDEAVLERLTGRRAYLFRPPYGRTPKRIAKLAAGRGLSTVEYDLASGDPDRTFTRTRLERWVLEEAKPGSIIVLHVNGHGWHTAEALPAIIAGLRAKGFALVTVGDLERALPPPANTAAKPAA